MNQSVIFRKIKLLLIITILVSIIIGFISFYFLNPEYQTYTTIMVGKSEESDKGFDYSNIILFKELITTYVEISKSKIVANEVVDNLRLGINYKNLDKKTKVTMIKETGIIKITVNYNDPYTAVKIADEYPKVISEHIKSIMNIENIQVIDKAEFPQKPIKPRPVLNMFLSFAIGIMVIAVIIIFDDNNKKVTYKSNEKEDKDDLNFINIYKNNNSLIITSSICDNRNIDFKLLGINLCSFNKKVIMIDCNIKKPYLHKAFDVLNDIGIHDIVKHNLDYRVIRKRTYINKLDIITSRNINFDIFTHYGDRINLLCNELCNDYEIIILDSVPIGLINYDLVYSKVLKISNHNDMSELYEKILRISHNTNV